MVGQRGIVVIHQTAARSDVYEPLHAAVAHRIAMLVVVESQPGDTQALQIITHHGRDAQIPERTGEYDRVRILELICQCKKRQAECARRRERVALGNVFCIIRCQVQRRQRKHVDISIGYLADQALGQTQRAGLGPADAAVDK